MERFVEQGECLLSAFWRANRFSRTLAFKIEYRVSRGTLSGTATGGANIKNSAASHPEVCWAGQMPEIAITSGY